MVYLENRTRGTGLDARAAARVCETLLAAIGEAGSSVSLTFIRDAEMRALNAEHRAKDTPTDVLSFPIFEPEDFDRTGQTRAHDHPVMLSPSKHGIERMLGDIVISVDTALRQAADYDAPLAREVERLLIHSVLHLAGHDHMESGERALMEAEERRLADTIGMPWPYLREATD